MHIYINFGIYEFSMDEGYDPLPQERVFTSPDRFERDIRMAYQIVCESHPGKLIGLASWRFEATPEEKEAIVCRAISESFDFRIG